MLQILKTLVGTINPQLLGNLDTDEFQGLDSLHIYCKDKRGRYLAGNENFIKDVGFNKIDDILKLTDFDLSCLTESQSANLYANDQFVIKSKKPKVMVESVSLFGGDKAIAISHKAPLISRSKKIIGVMGYSLILKNGQSGLDNELENLYNMTQAFSVFAPRSNNVLLLKKQHSSSFHSGIVIKGTYLSPREVECAYHLTLGKTAKMIAKLLKLSHRTVESYVNNLKIKLKVKSKSDLIYLLLNG